MLTHLCPQGHNSLEADYCSECGAKIQDLAKPVDSSVSSTICPDCSTVHSLDDGQFCGTCGHNFTTGAQGEIPLLPAPSAADWTVVIAVDPALRDPISPPAPDHPAQRLSLEKSVNLIGRTSQIRAIYPEISLDFDDAVSQRHGLLSLQPNGSLVFRDIGSSNGTKLNGVDVTVMADLPLQDRDELTLGHWTKLSICRS